MTDCIFCKIANGEIQPNKIYEDDLIVAFHDISPQAPVHVVVIPKRHVESVAELKESDAALAGHILVKVAEIAKSLQLKNGFRIISNAGADSGQSVFHLHFHVLGGRNLGADLLGS